MGLAEPGPDPEHIDEPDLVNIDEPHLGNIDGPDLGNIDEPHLGNDLALVACDEKDDVATAVVGLGWKWDGTPLPLHVRQRIAEEEFGCDCMLVIKFHWL